MRYLWILTLLFMGCDGPCPSNIYDCSGVCDGTLMIDCTGECGGDGSACGTVYDIHGNIYQTIQIGNQNWMSENLKTTHYNDGSEIQYVQSESSEPDVWSNLSTGAYGYYNDDSSHLETYGNLYNWYAVDEGDLCMEGWHVPSDEEFMELEMFLGMSESEASSTTSSNGNGTDEGSKLAGNADLWDSGALENNSEFGTSGFTGLPAGYRFSINGNYYYMGSISYFWSSSEYGSGNAWGRVLNDYNSGVSRYFNFYKQSGFSIRCLRD